MNPNNETTLRHLAAQFIAAQHFRLPEYGIGLIRRDRNAYPVFLFTDPTYLGDFVTIVSGSLADRPRCDLAIEGPMEIRLRGQEATWFAQLTDEERGVAINESLRFLSLPVVQAQIDCAEAALVEPGELPTISESLGDPNIIARREAVVAKRSSVASAGGVASEGAAVGARRVMIH